jgi:two-component system LytT family response regulator
MKKIRIVIIDDSERARKLLSLMLCEFKSIVEIIGEADQAYKGFEIIKNLQPDLVFLDIEMPGKSGIQLVEQLVNENINCAIVFTTAYNEYAIKAFRLSAIDYLLKPIKEKELMEAIEKYRKIHTNIDNTSNIKHFVESFQNELNKTINIPTSSGIIFTKVDDIICIKADGSYTNVYLVNSKTITVSKNLKFFENSLKDFQNFIRIHRSYLVNINYMTKYDKKNRGEITLINNVIIDIPRYRRESFFKLIYKQ